MAKIHIGTSGWSYPAGEGTWKGYFYPPGIKNELEYYSHFFNTVEVNSSFYRPPNPAYVANWVKRTPQGFLFTVKLWQKFTHPNMYRESVGEEVVISLDDIDMFRQSLEPLVKANKMGALLAQFPPSFKNDDFGKHILETLAKYFGQYHLAVELRDKSWSGDSITADILRQSNTAWVQIDEPKFASSIAFKTPLTSDMAYFRFHGRNAEMWWKGDVETRYQYLYSLEEINELAEKVNTGGQQKSLTFAFFNNHWKAYAPKNAVDMMRVLQLPISDIMVQRLPPTKE